MRQAVIFLYIFLQIIYLSPYLPGNTYMWAFGLITHVGMVAFAMHWLYLSEKEENLRLLFIYSKWLCIFNCIYIAACACKGNSFALYNTPLFAYILAIGFMTFLIHCAIKKI